MKSGYLKLAAGIFAPVIWLWAGCDMYRPGHGNLLEPGPKSVQKVVEEKLAEQRTPKTGPERWGRYKTDSYQSEDTIVRNREQIDRERNREAMAKTLIATGPLYLEECLAYALEFNDQIQAKRASIKAVGGDELITRSRFLPKFFYDLKQQNMQHKAVPPEFVQSLGGPIVYTPQSDHAQSTDNYVRYSQTLLEFGKDNSQDVALRDLQRKVLFDYEDTVRTVLSQVRVKFFTILLRQQQLSSRTGFLNVFQRQYNRIKGKYEENRQVVEVDVLTARLNVLNEESRINALKKEILRQKIDLMHLVGFPVGLTEFALRGESEVLELDLERIVDIALRRSTQIAQAHAVVVEQSRRTRQERYEYGPDIKLQTGWKDSKHAAGVELNGTNGYYNLNSFAEGHFDRPPEGILGQQEVLDPDQEGWFMGLFLELPVFEGFERKGRYARESGYLERDQHILRDMIDQTEQDVRKSYQTLLEQKVELQIMAERAQISEKRLHAKERLQELARITDNELETFREKFFVDQDAYFVSQISYIEAQEQLRLLMRYFDTLPAKEVKSDVPKK
jgi:outer membrane protein TolC